ncbi:MAG: sugar transferase [Bacteroidales bacterium]|jgi:lipopolysaccharide/colanic/teichoic acid biosynthesis glycosyltransferase
MYKLTKRLLDLLISLVAIIVFLPFFIPIALLLKFTGEGYIFYFQDRIGYKNKKFRIRKFATMLLASPSLGTGSITVQKDWRLTPMGPFLRKTKINEIPQIMNVLLGDMSIVGPRPQMEVDFMKFPPEIREVINNVKPGITGIGSIVFRDEERYFPNNGEDPHTFSARVLAPYKGKLELWYQDHAGILTDLQIIFLTAWVILFKKSQLAFRWFRDLPEKPEELR